MHVNSFGIGRGGVGGAEDAKTLCSGGSRGGLLRLPGRVGGASAFQVCGGSGRAAGSTGFIPAERRRSRHTGARQLDHRRAHNDSEANWRICSACALAARIAGATLCGLALQACGSGTSERGVRIGDETLAQFKAGTTTEDWLVAVLGPPSSCAPVRGVEQTRVLRYTSVEESDGLLSGILGRSVHTKAVTYFIVTNGVVTRFWADREIERTALGTPVETDPGSKGPPQRH